jgi:hypothetical protein
MRAAAFGLIMFSNGRRRVVIHGASLFLQPVMAPSPVLLLDFVSATVDCIRNRTVRELTRDNGRPCANGTGKYFP